MSARHVLPDPVEAALPWRGPCGFCGCPDARHRVLDAVAELVRAGDSLADTAADYELPIHVVEFIADHWTGDGMWLLESGR